MKKIQKGENLFEISEDNQHHSIAITPSQIILPNEHLTSLIPIEVHWRKQTKDKDRLETDITGSPYEDLKQHIRDTVASRASSKPSQRSWKSETYKIPQDHLSNILKTAAWDAERWHGKKHKQVKSKVKEDWIKLFTPPAYQFKQKKNHIQKQVTHTEASNESEEVNFNYKPNYLAITKSAAVRKQLIDK